MKSEFFFFAQSSCIFSDFLWLCITTCVVDALLHVLNVFNSSLLGNYVDLFKVQNKVSGMESKGQI